MARHKKTAGNSRTQPPHRRTQKVNVRRKAQMTSSSSGASKPLKASKHERSSWPGEQHLGSARTSAMKSEDADEEKQSHESVEPRTQPLSSKPSRGTERPVARSLRPEQEKPEAESQSTVSPWLVGVAALLIGGALWVGLRDQPNPDAPSQGEPAAQAAAVEPTPAAADVPAPPPIVAGTPASEPVLDTGATNTANVRRRVLSAKPKPVEEEPAPAVVEAPRGRFDSTAASGALDGAAERASSCRQGGDPTGVAKVVVTFAPTGRVTAATISGPPFAGTETGSCIAKTMRSMNVPAFQGEHVTISKTVVIM